MVYAVVVLAVAAAAAAAASASAAKTEPVATLVLPLEVATASAGASLRRGPDAAAVLRSVLSESSSASESADVGPSAAEQVRSAFAAVHRAAETAHRASAAADVTAVSGAMADLRRAEAALPADTLVSLDSASRRALRVFAGERVELRLRDSSADADADADAEAAGAAAFSATLKASKRREWAPLRPAAPSVAADAEGNAVSAPLSVLASGASLGGSAHPSAAAAAAAAMASGSTALGDWTLSVGTDRATGEASLRLMLRSALFPEVSLVLEPVPHAPLASGSYRLRVVAPQTALNEEVQGAERDARASIERRTTFAASMEAPASVRAALEQRVRESKGGEGLPTSAERRQCETGDVVDIAWLYSTAARVANSATNCELVIQNAAAELNFHVWPNSGAAGTVINVANMAETPFAEENTMNDLQTWSNSATATMQRSAPTYADVVFLMVERVYNSNPQVTSCGIAFTRGNSQNTPATFPADGLVRYSCSQDYYSFAHELGHNFGCNHGVTGETIDPWMAGGLGYADPQSRFRTILAYASMCAGSPCTRVGRFSSNVADWQGAAVGNAQRNNREVINQGSQFIASVTCNPNPTPVSSIPNPTAIAPQPSGASPAPVATTGVGVDIPPATASVPDVDTTLLIYIGIGVAACCCCLCISGMVFGKKKN